MPISNSKQVLVSELPECYHKELLQAMVVDPTTARINVVAVMGYIGDWSAYIGFPENIEEIVPEKRDPSMHYYVREVSSVQDVARSGDKLSKEAAEILFPEMVANYHYRS